MMLLLIRRHVFWSATSDLLLYHGNRSYSFPLVSFPFPSFLSPPELRLNLLNVYIFFKDPEHRSIFLMFSGVLWLSANGLGTQNFWRPGAIIQSETTNWNFWGYNHSETITRAKPLTASISIAHWYHFQKLIIFLFATRINLSLCNLRIKTCAKVMPRCDENSLSTWPIGAFWSFLLGRNTRDWNMKPFLIFPQVSSGFLVFLGFQPENCYLGHRFSCWAKRFSWHVASGNLVVVGLDSWFGGGVVVDSTFQSSNTLFAYVAALQGFFVGTFLDRVICLFWPWRGPKARAKESTRHASLIGHSWMQNGRRMHRKWQQNQRPCHYGTSLTAYNNAMMDSKAEIRVSDFCCQEPEARPNSVPEWLNGWIWCCKVCNSWMECFKLTSF